MTLPSPSRSKSGPDKKAHDLNALHLITPTSGSTGGHSPFHSQVAGDTKVDMLTTHLAREHTYIHTYVHIPQVCVYVCDTVEADATLQQYGAISAVC